MKRWASHTAKFIALILWLSIYLFPSKIRASSPSVKQDGRETFIGNNFLYLEDPTGRIGPQEILARQSEFRTLKPNELARGYSNSTFWLLIRVENQSAERELQLASLYPVSEVASYRIIDQEGAQLEHERVIDRRTPSTSLRVQPGSLQTFLVRISSSQLVSFELKISDEATLSSEESTQNLFFAMIFGCFVTAFLSNFVLFLILRHESYLYYLLFTFVNCHLAFIAIKFPGDILQWGGWDWGVLAHAYSPMGPLTTFLFVQNFLQTKTVFPKLDFVMRIYMVGLISLVILELVAYDPVYANAQDLYYLIGIGLLIFAGVRSYRSGFSPSRYYLLSLAFFLGGVALFLLRSLGVLPTNFITINGLVLGQTLEMLLMSLALSSKLNLMEKESARSAMKTQLLKVIAHDISTPLSIIKLSAQYHTSLGVEKSLSQILKASDMIENVIHYVHDRQVLNDSHDSVLSGVSINATFADVDFTFRHKAESKRLVLKIERLEEDVQVLAHQSHLAHHVIGNIVSNAIKFSPPEGEVVVRVKQVTRSKVVIEIVDQGIGMDKAAIRSLLTSSSVNSRNGTGGEKGMGYGMSIVNDFLKQFEGRLEIKSQLPKSSEAKPGTSFRLILNRYPKAGFKLNTLRRAKP